MVVKKNIFNSNWLTAMQLRGTTVEEKPEIWCKFPGLFNKLKKIWHGRVLNWQMEDFFDGLVVFSVLKTQWEYLDKTSYRWALRQNVWFQTKEQEIFNLLSEFASYMHLHCRVLYYNFSCILLIWIKQTLVR